jgi:ribonuclease BN (tRNA processing enzyme)
MAQPVPLELAFLGTGNAFAPERCWSGFLLNGRYLFDAPPTALLSLKRLSADLADIDTVLLSHFHSDHFYGLPFLLLEYSHRTHRTSDLTIVGPPGVEQRVHELMEIGYPGMLDHEAGFQLRFMELSDGLEAEVNGLDFEAVQVDHGGGRLECFGLKTSLSGRRLSYTGDTGWCDGLIRLGQDVEVLVTDCTYQSGRRRPDQHLSLEEIGELRAQLDPRTSVILTHLGGPTTPASLERTFVANDLQRYMFS